KVSDMILDKFGDEKFNIAVRYLNRDYQYEDLFKDDDPFLVVTDYTAKTRDEFGNTVKISYLDPKREFRGIPITGIKTFGIYVPCLLRRRIKKYFKKLSVTFK
ncbi:hypothetical protein DRJ22_05275, partial [Candidatus Woesearchaeota archaeon]